MPAFLLALFSSAGGYFASLAAFQVTEITKRLAMIAIAVSIILALTVAMWAGINALLSGIAVAMPAGITTAAGWIMPGNIAECSSVILTAKVARFAYDMKVSMTKLRAA